jgi:RNA polymerase primary sigma factor
MVSTAVQASLKKLIAKGKQRGYITYEEMNDELPEENISPEELDSLLMTLDEMGIEIIDEEEASKRSEAFGDEAGKNEEAKEEPEAEEIDTEAKRIDDPVRMYLTQMGEIPCSAAPRRSAWPRRSR